MKSIYLTLIKKSKCHIIIPQCTDVETINSDMYSKVSLHNVFQVQKEDPALAEIIDSLKRNTSSKYADDYVIEEDTLYHIGKPVRLDSQPRMQLVVPTSLVDTILDSYHDNNGHFGIAKTYQTIRSRYFWRNIYRDVVNHVAKCIVCNTRKLSVY